MPASLAIACPGPLRTEVSVKLSGVSVPRLRVWPALVAWATVVYSGHFADPDGRLFEACNSDAAGSK